MRLKILICLYSLLQRLNGLFNIQDSSDTFQIKKNPIRLSIITNPYNDYTIQ
jgi:hypothetical protein